MADKLPGAFRPGCASGVLLGQGQGLFKPKQLEEVEHIRIASRSQIILKPDEDFEL